MGGVTEWGGQLTAEATRRIACEASINRVVFDADDMAINAGRQVRLVRAPRRRVVVARDGGCRFHGWALEFDGREVVIRRPDGTILDSS